MTREEMTEQEFDKLEWQFNFHLNSGEHYSTVYKCKTIPNLYRCVKVSHKDGVPTNRGGYTHYMLDKKVYKSRQKLLEMMNKNSTTLTSAATSNAQSVTNAKGI